MKYLLLLGLCLSTLSAYHFEHPQRFEALYKELQKEGISQKRIQKIFAHTKRLKKESQAVSMIADRKKIRTHRIAEQKANEKLLLKTALLKKHLKKYKKVYDAVEKEYQVNREIIAAILQKETALGAFKAYKYDAFSVLVSMLDRLKLPENASEKDARRFERLLQFAHNNLVALIVYFENIGVDFLAQPVLSSYAGAVGIPQFTPQHFDLIVTAPGDHNRSLHHMPTAIYSTANLLTKRFGWKKMVRFSKLANLEIVVNKWYDFDDGNANFVYEKNLDGEKVPNFVDHHPEDESIAYVGDIVKVLKKYNFSTAYALGILEIAKKSHTN